MEESISELTISAVSNNFNKEDYNRVEIRLLKLHCFNNLFYFY